MTWYTYTMNTTVYVARKIITTSVSCAGIWLFSEILINFIDVFIVGFSTYRNYASRRGPSLR